MAAKIVLEPIFEADFKECSFGFRPKRSATQALETIRLLGGRGQRHVVDGDIQSFFDSIDQERLLERLRRRISDRRVLRLVRQWLKAGVMEEGRVRRAEAGTPQGGVISPLLANIVLSELDETWEREHGQLGTLVRYADDFVVLCRTAGQAREAHRRLGAILAAMRLTLHPVKTRVVQLTLRGDGFDFLGCHLRIVRSHFKGKTYLFRWPSTKAMTAIRARIRAVTHWRRWGRKLDLDEVAKALNPILRGWGAYFCTGNASRDAQHPPGGGPPPAPYGPVKGQACTRQRNDYADLGEVERECPILERIRVREVPEGAEDQDARTEEHHGHRKRGVPEELGQHCCGQNSQSCCDKNNAGRFEHGRLHSCFPHGAQDTAHRSGCCCPPYSAEP
jgi:group II intron reverse transcriptase/maturase